MFLDIAYKVFANLRSNLQVTKNFAKLRIFFSLVRFDVFKACLSVTFIDSFIQKFTEIRAVWEIFFRKKCLTGNKVNS